MIVQIPKKSGKIPPSGSHTARLIQIILLGTQVSANKEYADAPKIRLTWELPEEKEVFDEDQGPQPFVVSKEYTLSMNPKATFRKDLEAWRGRPFTDEEATVFDTSKVIGKPCMLSVMHSSKGDRTYANVATIANVPKGLTVPEQINATIQYDVKDGESIIFRSLPDWLQKKISESPEFQAATKGEDNCPDSTVDDADEIADSDIPF